MSFQTNYNARPDSGYHGMMADMQTWDSVSRRVAEAAGIAPGKGVTYLDPAATPLKVRVPTADTEEFAGFVRHDNVEPANELTGEILIEDKALAGVVTRGQMHVYAEDLTYAYGEKVYVIPTGASAGNVTNVSTSNIDANAIFVSKEASDRAIININKPV